MSLPLPPPLGAGAQSKESLLFPNNSVLTSSYGAPTVCLSVFVCRTRITTEFGGTAAPTSLERGRAGTEEVCQEKGLYRWRKSVGAGAGEEQGVRELIWECALGLEGGGHPL